MEKVKPTEEGLKRYPPDGVYMGVACTCLSTCPSDCIGQCGCEACHNCYADYLSVDYD